MREDIADGVMRLFIAIGQTRSAVERVWNVEK